MKRKQRENGKHREKANEKRHKVIVVIWLSSTPFGVKLGCVAFVSSAPFCCVVVLSCCRIWGKLLSMCLVLVVCIWPCCSVLISLSSLEIMIFICVCGHTDRDRIVVFSLHEVVVEAAKPRVEVY